jgi:hypothetical protein
VHGADRRAEGRHRRSQLKEIHNTGWDRGSGRREGKLTRRCRRHRSARSRSHRPSCRPPRPNLPDTSKHPSLLAIFSRRRRARRAYRERRRCLDAGGQAHRRRLRAPASGQPTSSAWRRGRLATAGILPQLLPLRLRRRRRTKRRRCRGASETAMRAGASARAFWPLLVGSPLSDSAETAVAALACGACGSWADGTRFGRRGGGGWQYMERWEEVARWVREREPLQGRRRERGK